MSRNPNTAPAKSKSALPFVIIGAVLLAVIAAVVLMSRPSVSNSTTAQNSGASTSPPQRQAPQPGASNPWARGMPTARVTVEEFSDFQCPACGALEPGLRRVMKEYEDRAQFIFRHYPLQQIHKNAFTAARAAEAAGMQGKFWEMADLLYERQAEWTKAEPARPLFVRYAQQLGLDLARFQQDIDGTGAAMRVVNDERRAASRNLGGTPTFIVNGRELKFEESNDLDKLSAAVERAMSGR